jgi:hypothetical protein
MNNKRVLQIATKELDKRKAPPAPKDIIVDPAGQWKYPGQVTRIPSNTITMQGVPYPVMGVPNKGEPTMMQPGQYYEFPDADYVDEYPQMKKGGAVPVIEDAGSFNAEGYWIPDWETMKKQARELNAKTVKTKNGAMIYFDDNWNVQSVNDNSQMKKGGGLKSKKYTRSLEGIGEVFRESALFKKSKSKKKKIFNPNAKYFQDGGEPGDKFKKRVMKRNPGMQGVYGPEGENLNIVKDPNYDAASKPYYAGDIEFMFPGLPQVSYANKVDSTLPDYVYANPSPDKYTSVYNPRGANRADIFLDMLHGMRDDQNYEVLLQNFDKAVRDARGGDMQYYYEQDVANNKYTDGQEQWDDNYVDGQLRAQLAPGTLGMFSHGRRDYRKERKYDSPEMRAAAKEIKNYLKTPKEEYIEADLTPEEIQEYAKGGFIIEELDNYAEGGDPGDVQCPPGYVYNPETKYCERKSGCPEGYTFDAKSGRCVSNYQKESIKVMAAPYKYRENGSVIDFPNAYEDSEFKPISEDQLVYKGSAQKSTWPKDFYVKDVSNPIYFKNSGVVHINTPEFVPEFEGDHEYYISTYPDLNYKVVVDSKKPEGFNKDENIYYVKSENTHQFKKYKEWEKLKALEKENLENAKKYGFTLDADPPSYSQKYPDEYYKTSLNKYNEDGEKIWDYEEGNYEYKPGWDEKKYRADHKTVQELYNDPEYLGWDAYDKSFDEIFKDRGTKNIETYKERCPDCTYFHGQRMTVDPDYMYDSYNPFQNKVVEGQMTRAFKTLEPDYADPNIDKQMPTLEEYGYPDMPGYNPASYKGKGIHPTYGYDKKARTHIGMHPGKRDSLKDKFYVHTTWDDDKDFRGFGTHDRTKLLPFIVQKSTGYNPEGMEGYYDEENNWVPGEYEKAAEEGRKINFQGAASVRDLRNQKEYQLKYEQYLKEKADIDKMNKELRQEWLPEPEVASQYARGGAVCPPGYIKVAGKCVPAGSATAEDSLAVYRNALDQKRYYDSLNKYYEEKSLIPYGRLTEAAKDHLTTKNLEQVEKDHLEYNPNFNSASDKKKLAKVKAQIKNNKQSNIYYFSDLITGMLDPNAPAMRYDARIKPQGMIEYIPKQYFADLPQKIRDDGYTLMRKNRKFAETYGEIGTKKALPISEYIKMGKKYGISEKNMRKIVKAVAQDNEISANLKGFHTTLPYYDPIAIKPSSLLSDKEVIERFKKYGASGISESRLKKLKLPVPSKKETKPQYKDAVKNKPEEHKYPTSYLPVVDNTPKVTPEGKVQVGTEKVMALDPKTGKVTTVITPVYENLEPTMPTLHPAYVNPELEKFIGTQRPVEEGWPGVMPEYDTEDLPEYATPDPDAEWVNQTERYIDWNANRIPYRLPRFRKPGHGGDLIKPGKRRYIPIPGIETRNSAYIQREDEEYRDGGEPKKKKNKKVEPFVTSDPDEYAFRKAAYDDSLYLTNKYNPVKPKTHKYSIYTGPTGNYMAKRVAVKQGYVPYTYTNVDNKYDMAGWSPAWEKFREENMHLRDRRIKNIPIGFATETSIFDTHALQTPFGIKSFTLPGETRNKETDYKVRFKPPVQPVKFVSPDDKKKNTSNKHLIKKPVPKVTEEPLPPVVVQEKPVMPIPPGPPPGIPPTPPIPVPPTGYPGIMPVYDTDELPMYPTPDPDAEWVGDTRRYIDWDGNSVGYNLPRVRKPGHGGDLIRKGKRRYLHLPSIETRYEAEIVPEEEYAMGGEYTVGDEVELSEAEVQRLRSLGYIIEEA